MMKKEKKRKESKKKFICGPVIPLVKVNSLLSTHFGVSA